MPTVAATTPTLCPACEGRKCKACDYQGTAAGALKAHLMCLACNGRGSSDGELDHPEAIASRFNPCPDVTCEDCRGTGLRWSDYGCACDVGSDTRSDLIAHPEAARLDAEGCLVCGACSVTALVAVLKIIAVPAAAKEAA